MKHLILLLNIVPIISLAQATHNHENYNSDHLSHIFHCRAQTAFVDSLGPPKLLVGIGTSDLQIDTQSDSAQLFFTQGTALMHCFWDFEAYRAFKEAIRHDSTAIMPYVGLLQSLSMSMQSERFQAYKQLAISKINQLKEQANEKERLYAEAELAFSQYKFEEVQQNLELIIHKFPEETEAKFRLVGMLLYQAGYDIDLKPNKNQIYSEFLIQDVLRKHPNHHAAHHYWIHQKENCCPEEALESARLLPSLAPKSGHIVHMPGHVYYKLGQYDKAYESFVASMKVDSAYQAEWGLDEVDNWNYIHNLNYLLANCSQDGRYQEGLKYAEKLNQMALALDRKEMHRKAYFYQGIVAPSKMEMSFGFWGRAADRLRAIQNPDTVYGKGEMNFVKGLLAFSEGKLAINQGNIDRAIHHSHALDALLWRNEKQTAESDQLVKNLFTNISNQLNVASLDLQGSILSAKGQHEAAIAILKEAVQKEKELGYSEPPAYPRSPLITLAEAYLQHQQYDEAIDTYEQLLLKHPQTIHAYLGMAEVYDKLDNKEQFAIYQEHIDEVLAHGDRELVGKD